MTANEVIKRFLTYYRHPNSQLYLITHPRCLATYFEELPSVYISGITIKNRDYKPILFPYYFIFVFNRRVYSFKRIFVY